MKYKKIWLFAGTTEGRKLCEFLKDKGVELWVSVATDYGQEMLEGDFYTKLLKERLTKEEMLNFLKIEAFDLVIDATHPYAQVVTQNIYEVCQETKTPYQRILRASYPKHDKLKCFKSIEAIVDFLDQTTGNVLLTTGSKDLERFTALKDFEKRLYPRILPMPKTLEACLAMGYKMSHLIAMQGPFSKAMNQAMLAHIDASYLVTKDSGDIGGFKDKLEAAQEIGATVLLLERPSEEEGLTLEESYRWLLSKILN